MPPPETLESHKSRAASPLVGKRSAELAPAESRADAWHSVQGPSDRLAAIQDAASYSTYGTEWDEAADVQVGSGTSTRKRNSLRLNPARRILTILRRSPIRDLLSVENAARPRQKTKLKRTKLSSESMDPATLNQLRGSMGVDASWYLATYPEVKNCGVEPAVHYFKIGWKEGKDPRSGFSTSGYLQANPDVDDSGMNPLIHFIRYGLAESRDIGLPPERRIPHEDAGLAWRSLFDRGLLRPRKGAAPPFAHKHFGAPGRKKLIFVGHEASRTGAPLILLQIMRTVATETNAELYLFLEQGGPLVDEFTELAHVIINEKNVFFGASDISVDHLIEGLAEPRPRQAVCNSASTYRYMQALKYCPEIRVVSLIHERMTHYTRFHHDLIIENSDTIVFSADAVRGFAMELDPRFGNSLVIPQGLLNREFGRAERTLARRRIRKELGLHPDALIVLACGSRDTRKGVDLFLRVAHRVMNALPLDIHFVWLGSKGTSSNRDQQFWIDHDTKHLGLSSRLHMLESRADPEPFFLASDVFLLTSRDDPFPNVVLEAMASRLPAIVFDGAGGAPEALAAGSGIVVPYLNLGAMAESVVEMLQNEDKREAIGRRAERRVRFIYDFEDYVDQIMALTEPEVRIPRLVFHEPVEAERQLTHSA